MKASKAVASLKKTPKPASRSDQDHRWEKFVFGGSPLLFWAIIIFMFMKALSN
jgi:hypothetical protein